MSDTDAGSGSNKLEKMALEKAQAALERLHQLLDSPNDNIAFQAAQEILARCVSAPSKAAPPVKSPSAPPLVKPGNVK